MTKGPLKNKVVCHITYTNEQTHKIILDNIGRSPLYGGKIEASLGDGYNPSLYPSKDVIVEITLEGTRLRQTITYAGHIVTV